MGLARSGRFARGPSRKTSHFDDETILDVSGRPRVVAVPGHTPGSVAFHLQAIGSRSSRQWTAGGVR
jgi:glyoxylase-like metal-dependent hydrolase (beta-lactamase superfamily II)